MTTEPWLPPNPQSPDAATTPAPQERRPQIIRSEDLLGDCSEVWIEHGDQMYRLRLTSSGKLYLTK